MELFKGYRVSSAYGVRENPTSDAHEAKEHRGIDLVKGDKSAICAFVGGKVVYAHFGEAGTGYGGYGNVVAIKDKNGYTHLYAHLDKIVAHVGIAVVEGQYIGTQGATGDVTGSHLHYEVRKEGWHTDVNPTEYLENYFKEDKPMDKQPEQWKLNIIAEAKAKGLIHEDHKPDDPAPKWFILQVALNAMNK